MLKEKIMNEMENNKIREGFLLKRSKYLKQWRQRWIVLTFNFLISFKTKDCKEITEVIELSSVDYYKSYINLKEEMVPAAFKVKSGDSMLYLCAKDAEQKWSWIVTIERLLDYRVSGATKYNNLTYIKTVGFKSMNQYLDGKQSISISKQSEQFKFTGPSSKDQQSLIMMKEIFRKQEEMKREKDLLRKQKKLLKKQIEQFELMRAKNPQMLNIQISPLVKKNSSPNFPTAKTSFVNEELTEIKEVLQEETILSLGSIEAKDPYSPKSINSIRLLISSKQQVIKGIFQQFVLNSQIFFGFKYFIDFLEHISSDERLGYSKYIINYSKMHPNKENFIEIFIDVIEDIRDYENCEYVLKFILLLLTENKELFNSKHLAIIKKKLIELFLSYQSVDKDDLIYVLKNLLILQNENIDKIEKIDQVNVKMAKIAKMSKRQQIRSNAKKLLT